MTLTDAGVLAGLRPIPELDAAREVWPRGQRLRGVREAGEAFKARFKAEGTAHGVRSVDLVTAPYPTRFAFHGACRLPAPYVWITNRMVVVQYQDLAGVRRTLVWEPTIPEGSAQAPFYAQTAAAVERLPGGRRLTDVALTKTHSDTDQALRACGLRPEDVDLVSFDHLHVQDVRMVVGTSTTPPLFPDALVLAQDKEVATLEDLHPVQWPWYVPDALHDARTDRLHRLDGSVQLGVGVAIVWTPGHTDGNHSLVVNTDDGVWVSSENGVALDNWQPELSRIPGLGAYHRFFRREVVPNANTLEDFQDQYDSMVLEKTLADACARDARWLQVLPSSELAPLRRAWPIRPTFRHGGIQHGRITPP